MKATSWIGLIFLAIIGFFSIWILPGKAQAPTFQTADTAWPMYQHDPQHTGRSPYLGAVHPPELLWSAQLPAYCSGENGGISIAQDGSLLLSIGGCLLNFDPVARELHWIYKYRDNSRSVPLAAADGNIYWGFGGEFSSISPEGATNWMVILDYNMVFGSSPNIDLEGNLFFVHDGFWQFSPSMENLWYISYGYLGTHASPAMSTDGLMIAGGSRDVCSYRTHIGGYWCVSTTGDGYDKTTAIGDDGMIYLPTRGYPDNPGYEHAGILGAITNTGTVEWEFASGEPNIYGIPDGIALSNDGSIYFGLNTGYELNYLYSIDTEGQFNWRAALPINILTGLRPYVRYPIATDRDGNVYVCTDNSRCYAYNSGGSKLWEFEFPLVDSILTNAGSEPVITADGLFYVFDSQARLYAYVDPHLYPELNTPSDVYNYNLEPGTPPFTLTLPIISTVAPVTYTTTISPSVGWITITQSISVTPANLQVQIDPQTLPVGRYPFNFQVRPYRKDGAWLDIPVTVNIGLTPVYLPLTMSNSKQYRILYASNWFKDNQIATIEQNGRNRLTAVANLPFQVDDFVFAPDGRKAAIVPYINEKHQINVMDTESGETILEIIDPVRSQHPAWSPDSSRLVFFSGRDEPENGALYVINLDGSGLTRLTYSMWVTEANARWSPTGEKIAFSSAAQIYLINPDGTGLQVVQTGYSLNDMIGWSPDGQVLLLDSVKYISGSPVQTLGTYDLQTGSYRTLTSHYQKGGTWSPDGSLIAFVGLDSPQFDLDVFVIRPDGSGEINLTDALGREDTQPAWSPDSRWLAFTSREHIIYNDPNFDIYVIRPDGSGLKQLTTNIQGDTYPSWQP